MKSLVMLVLTTMVALISKNIAADYLRVKFDDANGGGKNLSCVA